MQSAPYLFYDKKGVKSNESGYPAVPGGATYPPVSMVTSSNPPVLPEGTTSLHFALGNLKTPDIEMILKQNPEAVKEIGNTLNPQLQNDKKSISRFTEKSQNDKKKHFEI